MAETALHGEPTLAEGSLGAALLVEDEALVAIIAEESLRAIGYEPDLAVNADTARKALASGVDYALVVIDVGLPDGRGDALLPELRLSRPTLPVIVVSGYEEDELRARFDRDPHLIVVPKPYTEMDLARAARALGLRCLDL